MGRRKVVIPYTPRRWAVPFHGSFLRWFALVLHRRIGKTTAIVNHHQRYAMDDALEARRLKHLVPKLTDAEIKPLLRERLYGHIMPSYRQAKRVAWGMLKHYADPIPGIRTNESELYVQYPNGSKVMLFGADNPDSFRGIAFSGVSFDEYDQQPANLFGEVISKALADHLGYAVFGGTLKGKGKLYKTYQAAKDDPEWLAVWQDIDASFELESGVTIELLKQAMADDRKLIGQGLMTQAEFDQEWFLSPEAAIKGAFYGDQISALRKKGHITRVPHDPSLPVDTDWDLGIDAMAVWFSQSTKMGEVRLIDYHEDVGGGMEAAIKAIRGQQPNPGDDPKIAAANARRAGYTYGEHWGPHDIETREISTGKSRRELAYSLGLKFRVTRKLPVDDGITAAQFLLSRCWFDEENTSDGLEALTHYRRTYSQRLDQYTSTPVHDWASHGADAFRGLAVRHRPPAEKEEPEELPLPVGHWQSA